jgi:hypothetical protein
MTKIYKTQQEVEKDIKNGVLEVEGDVKFECSISINASIVVNAGNINAWDINAWDINAGDINAWDINAWDINAWNINARNINALDINARDINARDIKYFAFLLAYNSIKCNSYEAKRERHQEPICLDGSLEIIKKEYEKEYEEVKKAIKLLVKKGKIKDGRILI